VFEMGRLKPEKIVVFAPNWVGDAVMATPALAALRQRFPQARITALVRPYVAQVLEGLECLDEVRPLNSLKRNAGTVRLLADARALRGEGFDLAVLFANSFRTGLMALLAGTGRRIGYGREGRGILLTDRLRAARRGGRFEPGPMVDYYLAIAEALGAPVDDRRLRLAATRGEEAHADRLLSEFEVDGSKPIAAVNPGAAFGSAKCWPAENFARTADALVERGFETLVVTGPKEREIGETIGAKARIPLKPFWRADVPLGTLKAIVARSTVLVSNDSGPRHFAAAFDVPVVTIMGPTDPRWSDTGYRREIVLRKDVDCGPCMLRTCPRDHSCMTLITPEEVVTAVEQLTQAGKASEPRGAVC
jgi:heptosyltransferase-2